MWKKIVSELIDSGLSQREIAQRVGCSQPYICDLAKGNCGKRIGFELGNRLRELHQQRCNNGQAAA